MRGNFIVGLALGALAGMTLLDSSSQIKKVFSKGKQAVSKMVEKTDMQSGSQN